MQIPAQYFVQIIEHLRQVRSSPAEVELRRVPRYAVHSPVRIVSIPCAAECHGVTVLARNLAQGGIGLLQTHPAKVGLLFVCGLPRPRTVPLLVLCSVRFAGAVADNVYSIGAEFVKIVGAEDAAYARILAAMTATSSGRETTSGYDGSH